jgi:DNA-binding CsgD family transcriptional regulator
LKNAEAKEAAAALFDGQRNRIGDFSLSSETHLPTTIPDAVRRCRWIAVDLNAVGFAVFVAGPSTEHTLLVPCFDSSYPDIEDETRLMAGDDNIGIVQHARLSTVPCWWNDAEDCTSSRAFEALDWCERTAPLATGTTGIVFPVQAERGQSGLVVFHGPDIAISSEALFEFHARCFTLFEAVARLRPGESAKFPSISKRELECLKLTANGYTSEAIARLLKLSVHTTNQYLTNSQQKLDTVNRIHAVAKALRMGLIE